MSRKDDKLRQFALTLRERKGVPWKTAKIALVEGQGEWVEFFRGKDFARFFRANPTKIPSNIMNLKEGMSTDEQIDEVALLLIRRGLIRRADRKFKRPKPGKQRLVKYPRSLEPVKEQIWSEDSFYVWTFERPTSMWFYFGALMLVVAVFGATLFPLAPYVVKTYTIYSLMAFLGFMLGLVAVRYVLFGSVWIVSGCSLWLFPNMLLDSVGILDAFSPFITFERPRDGNYRYLSRLLALIFAAGIVYALMSHTPDQETLKEGAKKANDAILDFLESYGKTQERITGPSGGSDDKAGAAQ